MSYISTKLTHIQLRRSCVSFQIVEGNLDGNIVIKVLVQYQETPVALPALVLSALQEVATIIVSIL